jgi:hypothetical protein
MRRTEIRVLIGAVALAAALAPGRAAEACENDKDCKGDRVCYEKNCIAPDVAAELERRALEGTPAAAEQTSPPAPEATSTTAAAQSPAPMPVGTPTNLSASQAVLSVVLDSKKVAEADVYVDGQLVGQTPWQGVVVPGEHKVRVVPKNAYGPKEKETKVWPQRTRVLEFGGFMSNDQNTWTEWLGLRLFGGFSLHQPFRLRDGEWGDPDVNCPGGEYYHSDNHDPDPNCDYIVGNKPLPWDYIMRVPTFLAGGEMSLFTVRWLHFYWELINGGGGWPLFGYWGTALGVPIHFEKSEIRIGAHLTMLYGFYPTASGLELYWVRHVARYFALEIGIKQFSFPFAMGLTLGFRV